MTLSPILARETGPMGEERDLPSSVGGRTAGIACSNQISLTKTLSELSSRKFQQYIREGLSCPGTRALPGPAGTSLTLLLNMTQVSPFCTQELPQSLACSGSLINVGKRCST